ncbi:hypothetical protein [Arabiibacter massiliensis]|uniref:hypothetical protein n=1 Tax=Arabiibacter massiliensis TaxID=1870985 RepID=UPI0009BA84FC|nr:hypothetical protein [Arabiibacter massiliensis]
MSDIAQADVPANKDLADRKAACEPTFDEKVNGLMRFIHFEPLIRELDYQVLLYCTERKGLSDIEEHLASLPEFKAATRDQYSLITELVHHHGLEFFELDEAGNPVGEADKAGLTENEVDDLVAGYAYRTTEAGLEVAARMDPARRLADLLEAEPHRRDAYLALLEFLQEAHSFAQVDGFLRGCNVAELARQAGDGGVQPSVFVDKLERAGVIIYDGGWQATEAGRAALAQLSAEAGRAANAKAMTPVHA